MSAANIAEIARQYKEGVSIRSMVKTLTIARSTIKRYITNWSHNYTLGTLVI